MCVLLTVLLIAGLGQVSSEASVSQSDIGVADLVDYLGSLARGPSHLRCRRFTQLPGEGQPDAWPDAWQYSEEEILIGNDAVYGRLSRQTKSEGAPFVMEKAWSDGVERDVSFDGKRRLIRLEAAPFVWVPGSNVSEIAIPGLFISNPSEPNAVVGALKAGQVHSITADKHSVRCVFYLQDPDLERWTAVFEVAPRLRLQSLTCEQAVTPLDRPFEQRVFVRTVVTVLEWMDCGGLDCPRRTQNDCTIHYLALPRDQWPPDLPDDGVKHSVGGWEFVAVDPLEQAELERRLESSTPAVGDFVEDRRLGLGYTIGGNMVVQSADRFQLPPGETIDRLLDESFLERLPTLKAFPAAGRPTSPNAVKRQVGWGTIFVGVGLVGVGLAILFALRRRP